MLSFQCCEECRVLFVYGVILLQDSIFDSRVRDVELRVIWMLPNKLSLCCIKDVDTIIQAPHTAARFLKLVGTLFQQGLCELCEAEKSIQFEAGSIRTTP